MEVTLKSRRNPDAAFEAACRSTVARRLQLKGQLAFVTISAVDIGVTNITSFKPFPIPSLSFFAQTRFCH